MIAIAVYVLCALTSTACAVMLLRGYARSRTRFLLWSSLCFGALAMNNALLFIDKVIIPGTTEFLGITFVLWRTIFAVSGLTVLIYGLVWDAE